MSQLIFNAPKIKQVSRNPRQGRSFNTKPWMTAGLQIAFILVSLFMVYNVVKSISLTNQKLQILSQAEQDVQQLRLENIRLYLEKNATSTDDYIEAEARNRLYYSRKGETQYVIPEAMLNRYLNSSAQSVIEGKIEGNSTLQSWLLFFTQGI